MNPEQFKTALQAQGIDLSDTQMAQFDQYYQFLVAANQHVNLTTITAKNEVYLKHFYDSLTAAFYVPALREQPLTLCDVGAGAGFPSIPLKIAFPQLQVTIVDSLNKRISFLNELAAKLELEQVAFHHARAEEFGNKRAPQREQFDIVTARAVARLSVLAELCLPLVNLNGQMIALKATQAPQELAQAAYAIELLGGKVAADHRFELPESHDPRHVIVIDKIARTPKRYPRKAGTPSRTPLEEE